MHCIKCNINWSRLLTCDVNSEEQVEVCPVCLTDSFLHDIESAGSYFRCAITGNVTQLKTKEVLNLVPVIKEKPVKMKPAMTRTWSEWERLEDAGLEAYFKSGNPDDYFKAFNQ